MDHATWALVNWTALDVSEVDFLPLALSEEFKLGLIITLSIIAVGSVVGNTAVILVTLLHENMRTVTQIFLVSLAFSDVMISVWNIPIQLYFFVNAEWELGAAMCKSTSYLKGTNIVASMCALMAVAFER